MLFRSLVNALNQSGQTALHVAVLTGHREVAALLLARGANVGVRDREGKSVVIIATETGDEEMMKVIQPYLQVYRSR